MTRRHFIFSITATLLAALVGICSLLPALRGLPDAVLLLAPLPAMVALIWDGPAVEILPSTSLPLWTRLLWLVLLVGVVLLSLSGGVSYFIGGTGTRLAGFAPGWPFGGVWFGYIAVLRSWAKLRRTQA